MVHIARDCRRRCSNEPGLQILMTNLAEAESRHPASCRYISSLSDVTEDLSDMISTKLTRALRSFFSPVHLGSTEIPKRDGHTRNILHNGPLCSAPDVVVSGFPQYHDMG